MFFLALSWNTNENPSTYKLSRAINENPSTYKVELGNQLVDNGTQGALTLADV